MIDDPRITWKLANPYGIAIDETKEQWWAGRVFDVVEIEDGHWGQLVATETGGVWLIDANNHAIPLSNNWDHPASNCLLAGTRSDRHFYVGTRAGAIYETNYQSKAPLLDWYPIADALPASAGAVFDLEFFRYAQVLVAACAGGLYWSKIPERVPWWCLSPKLGIEIAGKTRYAWIRVADPPTASGYWSLCRTYHGRSEKLLVGAMSGGIYVGVWRAGGIELHRPILNYLGGNWANVMFGLATGNTSVASCQDSPLYAYAVCAKADGRMHMVLKSSDAGENWTFTEYGIREAGGVVQNDLRLAAGGQGSTAGANNCIAVHSSAPGVVAIGWQHGTFISPQAGSDWIHVPSHVHHADIHCLRFRQTAAAAEHQLLIGGDGGLCRVPVEKVIGFDPYEAKSDYNRNLANLQHYGAHVDWRQFYGTLGSGPGGLVSAGVHDNGNLHSSLTDPVTPWKQIAGGDGGWTAIVPGPHIVGNIMGSPATENAYVAGQLVPGMMIPSDLAATGLVSPIGDRVLRPRFTNDAGELLVGCAGAFGAGGAVFGLFQLAGGASHRWRPLGDVGPGLQVTAVGSFDGTHIVVAASGRLFFLQSATSAVREIGVILPSPSSGVVQSGGIIDRLALIDNDRGLAMLNGALLNGSSPGFNYVLSFDGRLCAAPMGNGLPLDQPFWGLDVTIVRSGRWLAFVSTEVHVFLSEDLGENWRQASSNLPRRAYCGDLRFGDVDGRPHILLATFGRSLWKADIGRFT